MSAFTWGWRSLYSDLKKKRENSSKKLENNELKVRLAIPRIRMCYMPTINKMTQVWHKNAYADKWKI